MGLFKPNVEKMLQHRDIKGLLKALSDNEKDIANAAAQALGQIGDANTAHSLVAELKVGWKIGKIPSFTPSMFARPRGKLGRSNNRVARAIGEIGSQDVVPDLLALLSHRDRDTRLGAISALGELKSNEAVPALIQTLKDQDSAIQGMCIWTLGLIGNKEAIPALHDHLRDSDSSHKVLTILALEALGDRSFLPAVKQLLAQDDPSIDAALVLIRMEGVAALQDLLVALWNLVDSQDEFGAIRKIENFLDAIAGMKDPAVIPPLLQFKEDLRPQYSQTTVYDSYAKQAAREKIDEVVKKLKQS